MCVSFVQDLNAATPSPHQCLRVGVTDDLSTNRKTFVGVGFIELPKELPTAKNPIRRSNVKVPMAPGDASVKEQKDKPWFKPFEIELTFQYEIFAGSRW